MKTSQMYKIFKIINPIIKPVMKNIKLILIGIAVLFLTAAIVIVKIQAKKIKAQKAEIDRVQGNNTQLMGENRQNTTLVLRKDEVNGKLRGTIDSLSKVLQIKPKQIEKIVTKTVIQKDTVIKKVPVYTSGQNFWKIKDSGPCFKWQADAFILDDSLSVNRTLFSYSNKTTDAFYKERPWKFLFIKFGKWQYKQKTNSECGESVTKEIQFLR